MYGTNRTRAKASALIEQGLIWRDTPREVAAAAQVVFSMVTDDAALAAVTVGPGRDPGRPAAGERLRRHEHGEPAGQPRAGRAGARGRRHHDRRPGLRQRPAAENGTLAIMVGGPDRGLPARSRRCCASWAAASPTSAGTARACCSSWRSTSASPPRCSPSARGCCWPSAAGSTRAGRPGDDRSPRSDHRCCRRALPSSCDLPEQAWFDVQLMHKDIRLALEAARQSAVPLPAASAADSVLGHGRGAGLRAPRHRRPVTRCWPPRRPGQRPPARPAPRREPGRRRPRAA